MEDVCEALDQTVIDIFQTLEELYSVKDNLEEAIQDGFFQMSRSRYNIGLKRVDADQILDAELSCNRSVGVKEDAQDFIVNQSRDKSGKRCDKNNDIQVFRLLCHQKNEKERESDSNMKKSEDSESSTKLRKRGKVAEVKTDADVASDNLSQMSLSEEKSSGLIESPESKMETKFILKDPINLFGVLVPQSLRHSQHSFENAVSLSVDIANLQTKLSILQKRFQHLSKEKMLLRETSKD